MNIFFAISHSYEVYVQTLIVRTEWTANKNDFFLKHSYTIIHLCAHMLH